MVEASLNISFRPDFFQVGFTVVENEGDEVSSKTLAIRLFFLGIDFTYYY